MSPAFPDSPIDEEGHLRVLSLEPARYRDANLIGSLRVTTLRDEYEELVEPYTAISYVWGDPTPVDKILLNGHDLGITENLGAALRDIRDATRVRRIWADAICIDQRNIDERNQQVAMMGQIYFHANSTIIYLGPLEPHSEFVLRAVQEAVRQDGYTINVTDESPLKMPRDAPYDVETVVSEAEKGLLFRPWFRRIWVLQELVLSRNPWVQCGTIRVRWRDLCGFIIPLLKSVAKAKLGIKAENGPVYDIESMNDIRAEYSRRGAHPPHDSADSTSSSRLLRSKLKKHKIRRPCSLREILRTRLGCQLSDPRDAIFAHLGIISDRDEILKFVKLDYNQTITELLTAVARAFIKQGGLELLMEGITPSHPLRSILPSWVPDWRIEISRETLRRELELTSTSSLCHSTYAEPFGTMSEWEILCVSGPLPSPSAYPSTFRVLMRFDKTDDPSEGRARWVWEEFWKLGAAVGDDSSARRLAALQFWPDELCRLRALWLGHEFYSFLPWRNVIDVVDRYTGNERAEPCQIAFLANGTLRLVTHEAVAGDIVATIISSPERFKPWVTGTGYGKTIVARICAVPGESRFELDYMRWHDSHTPNARPRAFGFRHCVLLDSFERIKWYDFLLDEWQTDLDSPKRWTVYDRRREGFDGPVAGIIVLY